ncbi:hypothetical protein C8J56DRAFT_1040180 [Mycena floridula]|nr:hypothetical protein C8J56DRAFT_1040180 [Mycena floridula]
MSEITELFPAPSVLPLSKIGPSVWPGISPESTASLQAVLKDNHEKWHIFINEIGFHNHTAHHSLVIWALGGSGSVIEAAYKQDTLETIPAFDSPEAITAENFQQHLGDRRYWKAYLKFFTELVEKQDISAVVEEYIFSHKANFNPSLKSGHPQMLDRFLASLVHPMIHLGYGLEFGLPGIVLEGLAQTAVHDVEATPCLPKSLFDTVESSQPSTHAFTILARILKDHDFDSASKRPDMFAMYPAAMEKYGPLVGKYVDMWTINTSDPKNIERKVVELQWTVVIMFGTANWSEKSFNADFFLMHLVTSSLFLPSVIAKLSPKSQGMLLRGYFAICLIWWICRGRPAFNIEGFFAADTAHPVLSSSELPKHPALALPPGIANEPNPWFTAVQIAIASSDTHLPKLIRALAHFGKLYGSRRAGLSDFRDTELVGAEKLDGSLFIRTAGLVVARTAQNINANNPNLPNWDYRGYYA